MVCPICERRKLTGSTGLKGASHCRDCHRTWSGTKQAHCVKCHQHFSCVKAADRHIIFADKLDEGYCLYPSDVTDKHNVPVLAVRIDKYGPTWHFNHPSPFGMTKERSS